MLTWHPPVVVLHRVMVVNNCYSMVRGCLIIAFHRQSTAGRYPAGGHYQATKDCRYAAMATCLETVAPDVLSEVRAYIWLGSCYIRLKFTYMRLRYCFTSVPCYNNG